MAAIYLAARGVRVAGIGGGSGGGAMDAGSGGDREKRPVRVVNRGPVDAELDAVVAMGTLGVSNEPGHFRLLYKIAVENGSGDDDCYARVERVTATDVVISCTPEKSQPRTNRKFVYDLRAKALVQRVNYDPFAMRRVFVSGEKAIFVGTGGRRRVAVEYRGGQVRLFRDAEAARWTGEPIHAHKRRGRRDDKFAVCHRTNREIDETIPAARLDL